MRKLLAPNLCFGFCKMAGLGLLFAYWVESGETAGFFLLLFLTLMSLLRLRVPKLGLSVGLDLAICLLLFRMGVLPGMFLALPLFEALYLGHYWAVLALGFAPPLQLAFLAAVALCGFLLRAWERERKERQLLRDAEAGRYYALEALQNDLLSALAQIEQMTAVHERARIARDIHDNAGHEIVAAYMSFQTVRNLLPQEETALLELYDLALARLRGGTDRIREAVHNLSTVSFLGIERLWQKCESFTACTVERSVYGDTEHIPIYVWSMLESCLSEALTNIARHAAATWVRVELDATPHIVRLCVENDGVRVQRLPPGRGLRNLRHRAAAIGGSLSVDSGELFRLVCVVPLRPKGGEG